MPDRMGDVVFYSFFGNRQLVGDFFVCKPFGPAQFKNQLPFLWKGLNDLVDSRFDFVKFKGIVVLIFFCDRTEIDLFL